MAQAPRRRHRLRRFHATVTFRVDALPARPARWVGLRQNDGMKSALFVDFDNVYSGLKTLDPAIADRFARQPSLWLNWLLSDLALPEHAPEQVRRRLLVRRVYLNPQVYQGYRAGFNHAGFEIVDCPAMTTHGKTSTDIHMVLDMVELLQHEVNYDEFIVFSADADFTPVLRKLRRWDRRTTVLAVGFPSAAYRASADLLIDPDLFVREALGMGDPADAEDGEPVLSRPAGPVSRYLGNRPMARPEEKLVTPTAVTADEPVAASAGESLTDGPRSDGEPVPATATITPSFSLAAPTLPDGVTAEQVIDFLQTEVARSEIPVPCARLASRLMALHPRLAPDWCGHGSFRRFVQSLSLGPLEADWRGSGGYLYDPARHAPPRGPSINVVSEESWGVDATTLSLIRQVHDTTGVPLISPREFRGLLEATVADVAAEPFQLSETGKRVRDRCRDAGLDVSRLDVNWVLRGLLLCGHEFGKGQDDLPTLSYRLVGNLINLCRREQMVMDETTAGTLHRWISGRLGEPVATPAAT